MDTGTHEAFDGQIGWQGASEHLRRTGILFGGGDIVAAGQAGMIARAAQVAAFCRLARSAGGTRIGRIAVLLPRSLPDEEGWRREFRLAFAGVVARVATPPVGSASDPIDTIEIIRADDLRGASIVDLVSGLGPLGVAFVADAGLYRMAPDQALKYHPVAGEVWVEHVSRLASMLTRAAGNAYVWLDVGEAGAMSPDGHGALDCVDGFAVLIADTGDDPVEAGMQMRGWLQMAGEGRLGAALAEIEASRADDETAKFTKLRLYAEAGLDHLVQAALRNDPGSLTALDSDRRVAVAHLAEGAGVREVATSLLEASLEELWRCETIEMGLMVADRLGDRKLAAAYEARLESLFPTTWFLHELKYERAVRANDHALAARLASGHPDLKGAEEYHRVLGGRLAGADCDTSQIIEDFGRMFPARTPEVRIACARHLAGGGRRAQAIDVLLCRGHRVERSDVWRALRILDAGLLDDDAGMTTTVASTVVDAATSWLGSHPVDAGIRLRLSRLLQPDRIGEAAPAILMALLLRGFGRGYEPIVVPVLAGRQRALDEERATPIFEAILQWLTDAGPTVLGTRAYPLDLLLEPPDAIIEALHRMMEAAVRDLDGEDLRAALSVAVAVGGSIGMHGSTGTEDFGVLRVAACRHAFSGDTQLARDLAENMLRMTNGDHRRRHVAWYCYADVFARLNNDVEALIGLVCALASTREATWDQIFYESTLALRLLRSWGALPLGRGLLKTARTALEAMGATERYGHRLETLAIQLDAAELDPDDPRYHDAIVDLIDRMVGVAQVAEHRGAEIAVAVSVLAELLRLAGRAGLRPPEQAVELLWRMIPGTSAAIGALVQAIGADEPEAGVVARLAAGLAQPKYAEDLAFDVQHLVVLAHRLLGSKQADDARVAAFSIELLADRSVSLPGPGHPRLPAPLPSSLDDALAVARAVAANGIDVVLMGLADAGLTWLRVAPDGAVEGPVREAPDVFCPDQYRKWSVDFPWDYAGNRDLDVFRSSTERLGISTAPERAVFVADVALQALTPNLIRCGDTPLGRTHKLAAAPSLAWLAAARSRRTGGSGRIAWIPTAAPPGGWPYLQIVADSLSAAFAHHDFEVSTDGSMPRAIGSEIAVIAAHGQLVAQERRFFRSLRDDAAPAVSIEAVFETLEDTGLVILFVCSGGRLDRHPNANAMVGPVRQLLAAGCSTVIASPWRLDIGVPARWLPAFLDCWSRGMAAVDACWEANQAVRAKMGEHPQHWLALSVHGDPLLRRTEHGRG